MRIGFIKNRNGDSVIFDRSRIERAIEKAAEAAKIDSLSFIEPLTDEVIKALKEQLDHQERIIDVEEIQDMVEDKLMELGYYEIAKKYIIYREIRAREREEKKAKAQEKLEENKLKITKTNGKKEAFDIEKIKETYKRVSFGLNRKCKFEELEFSLKKYIVD
ncbi:MAG: hypothetical protein LBQ24_04825 [Candidatus Peribacteria bacterium]|jgi:ribonucleoside-diphosphate reductase alpha chain|nr:hypothetical protein [Candidatus Peribacteria bacterium]